MPQRRQIQAVILVLLLTLSIRVLAAESVEALIKRQSQEFSDASASGDRAVLGRYLDDNVIFMNETGELASKKEILSSAAPPPKGTSRSLTQSDFEMQIHGQVAVTKFTDALTQRIDGETLHFNYRSTEVWLDEQGTWRMISSQTMSLPGDPPSVALSPKSLNDYVGTYQAANIIYKIARSGDGLVGSINGGEPFAIKAELADILFTPGQPTIRRVFQRDAGGRVIGFVSLSAGRHLVLKRVG